MRWLPEEVLEVGCAISEPLKARYFLVVLASEALLRKLWFHEAKGLVFEKRGERSVSLAVRIEGPLRLLTREFNWGGSGSGTRANACGRCRRLCCVERCFFFTPADGGTNEFIIVAQ